MGTRGSLTGG